MKSTTSNLEQLRQQSKQKLSNFVNTLKQPNQTPFSGFNLFGTQTGTSKLVEKGKGGAKGAKGAPAKGAKGAPAKGAKGAPAKGAKGEAKGEAKSGAAPAGPIAGENKGIVGATDTVLENAGAIAKGINTGKLTEGMGQGVQGAMGAVGGIMTGLKEAYANIQKKFEEKRKEIMYNWKLFSSDERRVFNSFRMKMNIFLDSITIGLVTLYFQIIRPWDEKIPKPDPYPIEQFYKDMDIRNDGQ